VDRIQLDGRAGGQPVDDHEGLLRAPVIAALRRQRHRSGAVVLEDAGVARCEGGCGTDQETRRGRQEAPDPQHGIARAGSHLRFPSDASGVLAGVDDSHRTAGAEHRWTVESQHLETLRTTYACQLTSSFARKQSTWNAQLTRNSPPRSQQIKLGIKSVDKGEGAEGLVKGV
jgi:hypothetical protein